MNHEWIWRVLSPTQVLEVCTVCGIVRRTDDKNNSCKGPTKLRPMEEVIHG